MWNPTVILVPLLPPVKEPVTLLSVPMPGGWCGPDFCTQDSSEALIRMPVRWHQRRAGCQGGNSSLPACFQSCGQITATGLQHRWAGRQRAAVQEGWMRCCPPASLYFSTSRCWFQTGKHSAGLPEWPLSAAGLHWKSQAKDTLEAG